MMCRKVYCCLLSLALLLAAGCSKVKDISITSFGVESFSPKGLRSADAVLSVGIDNPAFAFTVTEITGVVKFKGEEMASFRTDTVAVDRRCVKVYDVPCSAVLDESVSLGRVLTLLGQGSLEGFTADVDARVRLRNGVAKTLHFKDLDLSEYAN